MEACLGDLSIFVTATLAVRECLDAGVAGNLGCDLFQKALARALEDADADGANGITPVDATAAFTRFKDRLPNVDWAGAARGENAFRESPGRLLASAPVADAFKRDDAIIVTNSVRFRWRDVRSQFRDRLSASKALSDWRASGFQPGPGQASGPGL